MKIFLSAIHYIRSLDRETIISLAKYGIAGSAAFLVDYLVLIGLHYVFDLPLTLSASVAYVLGLLTSFFANRLWVFRRGREGAMHRQFGMYISLVAVNYLFTIIFLNATEDIIPTYIGKILVVGIITLWNFVLYRLIIFRGVSNEQEKDPA